MIGWIILGVLLALILLILFLPLGVDLGYEGGSFHLSAKLGSVLIQLFPKKPKDKPEKQDKKKKRKKLEDGEEEKKKKPNKKPGLSLNRDELLEILQQVHFGIKRFNHAWKVDRFVLHYVASGPDPYDTAVFYGKVNAVLSSLAPLCRQRFQVKDCSVWTDVDFTADDFFLELGLAMTITLWRLLGVINRLGFGVLRILLRSKRRRKREEKELKKAGSVQQPADNTEEIPTETIQEEERMAANG